ncbi:MAG TPA: NAD-dependent epimerase/dehydratase family protein [Solimonas sp.]|nr:NAD-dependent epimerase/dehydratase family protein [Solimonas sp.]
MSSAPGEPVLVTGGSGFLGSALAAFLVRGGTPVRLAIRAKSGGPPAPPGCENRHVPEPTDADSWAPALAGVRTVFHVGGLVHVPQGNPAYSWEAHKTANVDVTAALARAARNCGVRRLVFVSTIGVHGADYGGPPVTESSPLAPPNHYCRSKLLAEQAMADALAGGACHGVILRPPLVHGPGVKGNMRSLVRAVRAGLWLPLASVRNRLSFIGIDNCVDALVHASLAPAASGAYVIADAETISTPDLLRTIASGMGKAPRLLPCPPGLLEWAGRATGRFDQAEKLTRSFTVDAGRFMRETGWSPPVPMRDGLEAMGRAFRPVSRDVTAPAPQS